eukprot:445281-Alexandrium_andersonii.AAC.1
MRSQRRPWLSKPHSALRTERSAAAGPGPQRGCRPASARCLASPAAHAARSPSRLRSGPQWHGRARSGDR